MLTVIKNVEVYNPEYLGKKDIYIERGSIGDICDDFEITSNSIEVNYIDGEGCYAFPGFIDGHVHIIGGGGEGGFTTRTPEIQLSEFIKAGITTVVGCIGTDGICRSMKDLVAKSKALTEEGITSYCYTGSYEIPVKTITGTPKGDIMLIDNIIGVGEVALSDHRSSQPIYEDFVNVVASSRVGGLLSGKAGVVNVHLGDGKSMMTYLFRVIDETEIPPTQLLPTHINRSSSLFEKGIEYVKKGGYLDFTTSSDPEYLEDTELTAAEALSKVIKSNIDKTHITFTSDGNGSMPLFNSKREMVGLGICSVSSLYDQCKSAINDYGVSIEDALSVITKNPANILKLPTKGTIEKDKDADIVLVDKKTLDIKYMIAKGNVLMEKGKIVKKGTFEAI